MRYELLGYKITEGQWKWSKRRAEKAVENYKNYLKEKNESNITLLEYWEKNKKELEFIRRNGKSYPEYWIPPRETVICDNNWFDVKGYEYSESVQTQKSEVLLKRIIEMSSKPGDIILDCFGGTGTTAISAQLLNRRWIICEINKNLIQTTAKRVQTIMKKQGGL